MTLTHCTYMSCPVGVKREPTGVYDLALMPPGERRIFIHNKIRNGELLAAIPFSDIKNMRQLRGALQWLYDQEQENRNGTD